MSDKHSQKAIELGECEPFAEGGSRLCFEHPDDPHRCIKIVKQGRIEELRQRAPVFKRLRPDRAFDDNEREIDAYQQRAIKLGDERLWLHLPRQYGYSETSMGPGLVTDLIRNSEGIADNLENYIKRDGMTDALSKALDEFCDWLRDTQVLTKNLLPHNVLVKAHDDGRLQLYVIDGIGCTTAIDPNWLGQRFVRRYIESRIAKMRARVAWEAGGRKGEWKKIEKQHRKWM